jgi:glycosyltransferase involved in cell wall biosynthesis
LKVIHITPSFYPFIGGISSAVGSLVRALHDLSIEQTVYVIQKAGSILKTDTYKYFGVKINYIFAPNEYLSPLYIKPILDIAKKECISDKVILHFHSPELIPVYSHLNLPIVLSPRTWHINTIRLRSNWVKKMILTLLLTKIYKKIYSKASLITAITNREMDFITKFYGVPNKKVIKLIDVSPLVYENTAEILVRKNMLRERFKIPNNYIVLLFVGRVERLKGVDILLDALSKIRARNILALIVGPVTDRKLTTANITNVKYLGPLVGSKLYKLYAVADIFVLPSRLETAPLAIQEAQIFGLPVIATDVGDVAEVVGNTGLLIKPGSSSELTSAILKLVEDDELRRRLSKKSLEKANRIKEEWRKSIEELAMRYYTLTN